MNLVIDNVFTAGSWPFGATQIIEAAGLEPSCAGIAF